MLSIVYSGFNPDVDKISRDVSVFKEITEEFIFVDNSPYPSSRLINFAKTNNTFKYIHNANKGGIGGAMNVARSMVKNSLVLLLDQDTMPSLDLIKSLIQNREEIIKKFSKNIIVGPKFDRKENAIEAGLKYRELKQVPTSGMLMSREVFIRQEFNESLFLDFVDFDWCWQSIDKFQVRIFELSNLKIHQKLGENVINFLGLNINVPNSFRHYFQFRDTIYLLNKSYVPLRSRFRFICLLPFKIIIYPMLLDSGIDRFKWMILGIYSAILKHKGIGLAKQFLNGK